jgi:tetratricopeptide (TPR) repeat protein
MSSPAETSQQQPSPTPHTGFDPIEFWFLHKIIALSALFVVALIGYTVFEVTQRNAREAANKAFAEAKTADDFKKVIAEHSGQTAAGNAQLKLAGLLRNEGKFEEAGKILRDFIEKYPAHPMIAGAWLSLGQNQEGAGKADEALAQYQKVLTTYPNSYAAPIALLSQGRIQKAKGQNDAAKRSFEQVISQYQFTQFQNEAQMELRTLDKPENASAVEPVVKPNEEAPSKPADAPAPKPADAPANKAPDAPVEKAADKPANESADNPVDKAAEKPGN